MQIATGPTRPRLLTLSLLAFAAVAFSSPALAANECRRECRDDKRECRAETRADYRECRTECTEGDDACRDACRAEKQEARAECAASSLDCAVDCRDDLDAACADVCVDDTLVCVDESSGCRSDCKAEFRAAVSSCRDQAEGDEGFDRRACIRSAKEQARACGSTCRGASGCGSGLRSCLDTCVVDETPTE